MSNIKILKIIVVIAVLIGCVSMSLNPIYAGADYWQIRAVIKPDIYGEGPITTGGCDGVVENTWTQAVPPALISVTPLGKPSEILYHDFIKRGKDAVVIPVFAPPPYEVTIDVWSNNYRVCPATSTSVILEQKDFDGDRYWRKPGRGRYLNISWNLWRKP